MTTEQKALADLDMRVRRTAGTWAVECRVLDVSATGATYAEAAEALRSHCAPTAEAMRQFRGSLLASAVRTLERLEALCEALGGAARG